MVRLDKSSCWSEVRAGCMQNIPSLQVAENVQWNVPVQHDVAERIIH